MNVNDILTKHWLHDKSALKLYTECKIRYQYMTMITLIQKKHED